jgi:hypothetical protein
MVKVRHFVSTLTLALPVRNPDADLHGLWI